MEDQNGLDFVQLARRIRSGNRLTVVLDAISPDLMLQLLSRAGLSDATAMRNKPNRRSAYIKSHRRQLCSQLNHEERSCEVVGAWFISQLAEAAVAVGGENDPQSQREAVDGQNLDANETRLWHSRLHERLMSWAEQGQWWQAALAVCAGHLSHTLPTDLDTQQIGVLLARLDDGEAFPELLGSVLDQLSRSATEPEPPTQIHALRGEALQVADALEELCQRIRLNGELPGDDETETIRSRLSGLRERFLDLRSTLGDLAADLALPEGVTPPEQCETLLGLIATGDYIQEQLFAQSEQQRETTRRVDEVTRLVQAVWRLARADGQPMTELDGAKNQAREIVERASAAPLDETTAQLLELLRREEHPLQMLVKLVTEDLDDAQQELAFETTSATFGARMAIAAVGKRLILQPPPEPTQCGEAAEPVMRSSEALHTIGEAQMEEATGRATGDESQHPIPEVEAEATVGATGPSRDIAPGDEAGASASDSKDGPPAQPVARNESREGADQVRDLPTSPGLGHLSVVAEQHVDAVPATPAPELDLFERASSVLQAWLGTWDEIPKAYLVLRWMHVQHPERANAYPPAYWSEIAYRVFQPSADGSILAEPDYEELNRINPATSELRLVRWCLEAAAVLLRGAPLSVEPLDLREHDSQSEFAPWHRLIEAVTTYLQWTSTPVRQAAKEVAQQGAGPDPGAERDRALIILASLTRPGRFNFLKGQRLSSYMDREFSRLRECLVRDSVTTEVETWLERFKPERDLDRWAEQIEPRTVPIDGRVRRAILRDLQALHNHYHRWVKLTSQVRAAGAAPRDATHFAVQQLAKTVLVEGATWGSTWLASRDLYPTLAGWSTLFKDRLYETCDSNSADLLRGE